MTSCPSSTSTLSCSRALVPKQLAGPWNKSKPLKIAMPKCYKRWTRSRTKSKIIILKKNASCPNKQKKSVELEADPSRVVGARPRNDREVAWIHHRTARLLSARATLPSIMACPDRTSRLCPDVQHFLPRAYHFSLPQKTMKYFKKNKKYCKLLYLLL